MKRTMNYHLLLILVIGTFIASCNKNQIKSRMLRITKVRDHDSMGWQRKTTQDEIISSELKVSLLDDEEKLTTIHPKFKNYPRKITQKYPALQYFRNILWCSKKNQFSINQNLLFHNDSESLLEKVHVSRVQVDSVNRKIKLYTTEDTIYELEYKPTWKNKTPHHENINGQLTKKLMTQIIGNQWEFSQGFLPYIHQDKFKNDFWAETIRPRRKGKNKNQKVLILCRSAWTQAAAKGLVKTFEDVFLPELGESSTCKDIVTEVMELWEDESNPYNSEILFLYPKEKLTKNSKNLLEFDFTTVSRSSIMKYLPPSIKRQYKLNLKRVKQEQNIKRSKIEELTKVVKENERSYYGNNSSSDLEIEEEECKLQEEPNTTKGSVNIFHPTIKTRNIEKHHSIQPEFTDFLTDLDLIQPNDPNKPKEDKNEIMFLFNTLSEKPKVESNTYENIIEDKNQNNTEETSSDNQNIENLEN